jgi:hypothetical protein
MSKITELINIAPPGAGHGTIYVKGQDGAAWVRHQSGVNQAAWYRQVVEKVLIENPDAVIDPSMLG